MTSLGAIIAFTLIGFLIVMLIVAVLVLWKLNKIKKDTKEKFERGEIKDDNKNQDTSSKHERDGEGFNRNSGGDATQVRETFRPTPERARLGERGILPKRIAPSFKLHRPPTE